MRVQYVENAFKGFVPGDYFLRTAVILTKPTGRYFLHCEIQVLDTNL